jgi:acetate kinase
MQTLDYRILAINGGSSSIKFAIFDNKQMLNKLVSGQIDKIGKSESTFKIDAADPSINFSRNIEASDFSVATRTLMEWIERYTEKFHLTAISHRIVTGGDRYFKPERITEAMLTDLRRFCLFDPEHLPDEIHLVQSFLGRFKNIPQYACFDTEFHHDLPFVARTLPIPRHYEKQGVRRYGFHGLSYQYLMNELTRENNTVPEKVVLAHLGSGSSLAAVLNGKSIDTSMGFTPASGIPMSTRAGDLDPGLGLYLSLTEKMGAKEFNDMVNFKSGLLGISETSSDMKDLLAIENQDVRAKEAIELFCYQVKKCIGAFTAALGGIDTLVFAGGIGESAPSVRTRICSGLGFLGIDLDQDRNATHADLISKNKSSVQVRVIHTDEEIMMAKAVSHFLKNHQKEEVLS